jgi:hypothetical protein
MTAEGSGNPAKQIIADECGWNLDFADLLSFGQYGGP